MAATFIRRSVKWLIVFAVVVDSMVGFWILVQWATLPFGLRPDGAACDYEVDPGSGTSGTGTERVDWGVVPDRVCVSDEGAVYRGAAVHGATQHYAFGLATLAAVPVVGALAGTATAAALKRRRSTSA